MEKESATLESVWATIRETHRLMQENDRILSEKIAETDRQQKETDRQLKEAVKQMAASGADVDRRIKNVNEMIGGMANSDGMFAEEYFFNCIEKGDKNIFGEHFDECYSSLKRYNKGNQKKSEHDILLINGAAAAIVEVKYKARREDIEKLINKLPDFRTLYPQYRSHRVYLGLAAMTFENGVENESAQKGIAIIKQDGDMVVINDEHLKVF